MNPRARLPSWTTSFRFERPELDPERRSGQREFHREHRFGPRPEHRLERREFLIRALGAALAPMALACQRDGSAPAKSRPNVLFLMADQLRWDALAVNGGRIVATPNLDRLSARSVNFRQAICAAPMCGPSRAGILTGRLMSAHGCLTNERADSVTGIRAEVPTFDEILAAAGYRCEYHGKWHTGGTHRDCYAVGPGDFLQEYRAEMLAKHGLPADASGAGWQHDFYTKLPYRPFEADLLIRAAIKNDVFIPHRPEIGETYLPAEDSLTAWTAQRVIRFLRSKPPTPFSFTGSFLAPHAPLIAPAPYSTLFDPREMPLPENMEDDWELPAHVRPIPAALPATPEGLGRFMALYYGLVAELDHWIGEILRALDESGLAEDTLVVFTSDHGELLGSHRMVSKGIFFEEALRVPLLVAAPGGRSGAASEACASGRDLFATLLDLCGAALPAGPLAARSLRAALESPVADAALDAAVSELNAGDERFYALRTREWKLVLSSGPPALFHLAEDPLERHEVLGDGKPEDRAVARELRERLKRTLDEEGDPEGARDLPSID
jgi:arylsulfatase A-like enzyme